MVAMELKYDMIEITCIYFYFVLSLFKGESGRPGFNGQVIYNDFFEFQK